MQDGLVRASRPSALSAASLRQLRGQFARFAAVGVFNTLASLALYQLLVGLVPYWLAYTAGFAVVFCISLLTNARIVFQKRITPRVGLRFLAVYLLNYAVGLAATAALVDLMQIPARLAGFGAAAFLIGFNFVGTRLAILR